MSDSPALTSLTIKDLRQLAGEHNLPNRSKLGKEELILALQAILADRAAASLQSAVPAPSAAVDAGEPVAAAAVTEAEAPKAQAETVAAPAPVEAHAAAPEVVAAPVETAKAENHAAAEAPALIAVAAHGANVSHLVPVGDEPEMITADSFKPAVDDDGDDAEGDDDGEEGDDATTDAAGEGAPGDAPPGERRRRRRRRRRGRGRRDGEAQGAPQGGPGAALAAPTGDTAAPVGAAGGEHSAPTAPVAAAPTETAAPVTASVPAAPAAPADAPQRPAMPAARLRSEVPQDRIQSGGLRENQGRDGRPQDGRDPRQNQHRQDGRGPDNRGPDSRGNDGRGQGRPEGRGHDGRGPDPRNQGDRPQRPRLDGVQRPVPSVLDRLCSFTKGILELCDPSTPGWAQPRLAELLAEAGMVPLPSSGMPHPDFHVVTGAYATTTVPAGHIAEIVAPGFALRGDRGDLFALRKSQVRVAEGAKAAAPTPAPAPVLAPVVVTSPIAETASVAALATHDGPEDLTAESAGGSAETETIPRDTALSATPVTTTDAPAAPVAEGAAAAADATTAPARQDDRGPRRDEGRRDDRGPRRDEGRRDDRGPRRDDRRRDDRGPRRDDRRRDDRRAPDGEPVADAEPSTETIEGRDAAAPPATGRAPLAVHPREPAGDAPALPLAMQVPDDHAARQKSEGFRALGLNDQILADLAAMGYQTPSPIQAEAIPIAITGRDLLGQAQTGTGKTAAFVLPMLQRLYSLDQVGPVALVLCPTRELARQVHSEFTRMAGASGARAAIIYGGVPMDDQVRALEHKPHVVIGTPGRIIDHMRRKVLDLSRLALVVLDEADQMLDIGFWPDVNFIISHTPPARQIMLFSATFPDPVKEMAAKHMKDPAHVRIQPRQVTVEQVDQKYIAVPRERKNELLAHFIETQNPEQLVVFCRTKHQTDRVAEVMKRKNISAAAIHGDLPQSKREKTLQAFRARELQCLIATNVAARGLDIPTVSHVVNYDIPEMPEEYVHRIGRTARNGARGVARTFITPDDGQFLLEIEKHIGLLLEEEIVEGFTLAPVAEVKRTIAELPAGVPRMLKPLVGGIRLGRRR